RCRAGADGQPGEPGHAEQLRHPGEQRGQRRGCHGRHHEPLGSGRRAWWTGGLQRHT
ncbi:hypothetical protein HPB47_023805, partial [Ixodes persulcatus]